MLGLIRLPSVPFLGAFSVGSARRRPRPLRITVLSCMMAKRRLVQLAYDVPGLPPWDAAALAEREFSTLKRCKAALDTPDADMRAILQDLVSPHSEP